MAVDDACPDPTARLPATEAPPGFALSVAHALANTHLLPHESLQGLQGFALHFERVALQPGATLFEQGDEGDGWYMVLTGVIGIVHDGDESQPQVLDHLEAPETFGEMALIDGAPRMAAAEALEPTVLARLPRDTFDQLLERRDPIAVSLLRAMSGVLCRRHRQLVGVMQDLVGFDESEFPDSPVQEGVLDALIKSTITWH